MLETPTPQVESSWSELHLVERCRGLRGTLLARGEPTASLDAFAPGGAENATTDPYGARVAEYALLRARVQFLDWRQEQEEARGHAALAAALANAPQSVTLSDGSTVAVHPKSYHALAWCDALDRALQEVGEKAMALEELGVRVMAPLTASLAVRIWAWILTCPEPGLPFEEGAPKTDPPEWTTSLTPGDILQLLQAHFTVNRERIALVAALFPPDREAQSKLSLSGFLGTVAQEMGQRPSDVLRRWSMGEAFAQAVVAAEASREARARAESDADRKRGV